MRTLTLVLGLIINFQPLTAEIINLSGVLNDISRDESKVLYTCKTKVNEPYSDGYIYLFDRQSNKNTKVAYDSSLDYSRKSFFINDDSILIIMAYKVSLYSIKNQSKRTIFSSPNKNTYIISSSIGTGSQKYITLCNSNDSKVSLMVFDSKSLSMKTIHSTKVKRLPTDNFFNYFVLGKDIFFLDNSLFYNIEDTTLNSTYKNIAFNNELGNHIIVSNGNSICFVEEKTKSYKLGLISEGTLKLQFLNIAITNPERTWIESMIHNNKFSVRVGNDFYEIGPRGEYRKIKSQTIYSGKTLTINKIEEYKIEFSSVLH